MKQRQGWIAWSCVLMLGLSSVASAQQAGSTAQAEARRGAVVVSGRVIEISAPRLFSLRDAEEGREVLVLAPRPLSPDVKDAIVRVEGIFRRLDAAQLKQAGSRRQVDQRVLARFSGRPVLVATSVLATLEGGGERAISPPAEEPASVEPPRREPPSGPPTPLSIRASMLAANVEELAGERVRILNARVVGLIEPSVFLVEPATRYPKPMGTRDRMVILIENGGALRVPTDLLVGSIVTIEGVVRTVLGVRTTSDVPWPARLEQDAVERLEIRGVVLARSVQTAEGVELTVRQVAAVPR